MGTRKSLKKQQEAATTIQAGVRGHQTRKALKANTETESGATSDTPEDGEVDAEEEEKDEVAGADDSASNEAVDTEAAKEAAVLEIQAAFFGKQAREESEAAMQAAQVAVDEETKAATTIQAGFRGHQTRKALKTKENAVLEIQAALLGYQARTAAEAVAAFKSAVGVKMTEDEAASIIQSRWRGFVAKKLLQNKQEAAHDITKSGAE